MDILLKKLFESDRYEKALDVAVKKGIDKGEIRKLTDPRIKANLYLAIRDGNYEIAPPHMQLIPKDKPGEFRTVYINENIDRIFLSMVNDIMLELMPEKIHPSCKSYQKGIGCGKIVQEVTRNIEEIETIDIGWKADLTKYFDSIAIEYIDNIFDDFESVYGKSVVIDVVRKYYHTDLCFDTDGNLIEHYQSLKQGCAVASALANMVLYHIDEELSELDGYYVRYSDDCLFIGNDYEKAMEILQTRLAEMKLTLNPKKVEYLQKNKWFKFLGFAIRGSHISLSGNRIKKFQKEIIKRTYGDRDNTLQKAVNKVNNYLYKGDYKGHSWATNILPIINTSTDINELNKFVLDCLRAVITGKHNIGGLGYIPDRRKGVIDRGKGRNVKANREKTPAIIDGYLTINCARQALLSDKEAYETLVRQL